MLLGCLAQCIGNNIQYSFGGRAPDGKCQLPFISFPAMTAMDSVVVTPPGETPPELRSDDFKETSKSRTLRKNSADVNEWNADGSSYSLAFGGSCIDLPWRVIDPFEMSLVRFWGKAPLRLVIYEKAGEPESSTDTTRDHIVQDGNNYLLGLQVEFLGTKEDSDRRAVDRKGEGAQVNPFESASMS